jgi:hypothetical protein
VVDAEAAPGDRRASRDGGASGQGRCIHQLEVVRSHDAYADVLAGDKRIRMESCWVVEVFCPETESS